MSTTYLPAGLPAPLPQADGLDRPYWEGTRQGILRVQRCRACATWQWGPEWLCHRCLSFEMDWEAVEPQGKVYAWARSWHPVHPALAGRGPFLLVLVELPHAGGVRMLGNLLGEAHQAVAVGDSVRAVFERHDAGGRDWTLVQWQRATT